MTTQAERSGEASAQLVEFATRLGSQLDQAGFSSNPKRAAQLSLRLGIGKAQIYKLLKGVAFPNLNSLIEFRRMGVSLDEILDSVGHVNPETTDVVIGGTSVSACVRFGGRARGSVFGVPHSDGRGLDVVVLEEGTKRPTGAKPLQALSFPQRATLAIIENNTRELAALAAGTKNTFALTTLTTARQLFEQDISDFDVFLLGWHLPDMPGRDVVRQLRKQTKAPIFILTGDMDATEDILGAMSDPMVRLITKPTAVKLINKILSDAVTASQP